MVLRVHERTALEDHFTSDARAAKAIGVVVEGRVEGLEELPIGVAVDVIVRDAELVAASKDLTALRVPLLVVAPEVLVGPAERDDAAEVPGA